MSSNRKLQEMSTSTEHTILLIQPSGKKPEKRTYSDYETLDECLEGVYDTRSTTSDPPPTSPTLTEW